MGTTRVTLTVLNIFDEKDAAAGLLPEREIRQAVITAKVDTGAMRLYITDEIRQKLGLQIAGTRTARVANGEIVQCKITAPVKAVWQDRFFIDNAWILPEATGNLLGVLPLEAMDLRVDPVNQRLVGIHGDEWMDEIG